MSNRVSGFIFLVSKDAEKIERLVNDIKIDEQNHVIGLHERNVYFDMHNLRTANLNNYLGVEMYTNGFCLSTIIDICNKYSVIAYGTAYIEGGFDTQHFIYYNNIGQLSETSANTFWMGGYGDAANSYMNGLYNSINIYECRNIEKNINRFLKGDYVRLDESILLTSTHVHGYIADTNKNINIYEEEDEFKKQEREKVINKFHNICRSIQECNDDNYDDKDDFYRAIIIENSDDTLPEPEWEHKYSEINESMVDIINELRFTNHEYNK